MEAYLGQQGEKGGMLVVCVGFVCLLGLLRRTYHVKQ